MNTSDDLDGGCGGDVARLAGMPTGAGLVAALAGIAVEQLDAHDLVAVIQGWERLKAFVDGRQVSAMARLAADEAYQRCDRRQDVDIGHTHRAIDPCGDELSLALAWSPGRAKQRLATAVGLVDHLPATLHALHDGVVDGDKAALIVERTRCLAIGEQRREVEARALAVAARKTRGQLDIVLRRAVMVVDPEGAARRRAVAAQGRRISRVEPAAAGGEDGMGFVSVCGPVEDLTALYTAVDAAARRQRSTGDERTLEQLRFDVLTGLGWAGLELGHLGCCNPACALTGADATAACDAAHEPRPAAAPSPAPAPGPAVPAGPGVPGAKAPRAAAGWPLARSRGRPVTVNVTVALSTLLGVEELPGWLDGFGSITGGAARQLAARGVWRRLVTDPVDGQLLEYGRKTYTPPAHLAAFIAARDRTCRFPTCSHSARDTEIDHKVPYAAGGQTGAGNLWALHKAHHVSKTLHGHRVHADNHGVSWWITPAGRRYRVEAEAIHPINQSAAKKEDRQSLESLSHPQQQPPHPEQPPF